MNNFFYVNKSSFKKQNLDQYIIGNNKNEQNTDKYKKVLCKHFQTKKGCTQGDECKFAHGEEDIIKHSIVIYFFIKAFNNHKTKK